MGNKHFDENGNEIERVIVRKKYPKGSKFVFDPSDRHKENPIAARCGNCEVVKTIDCFPRRIGKVYQVAEHCADCTNEKYKQQYADQSRGKHLERKYGITESQYDEMLGKQCGGCAICGQPENPCSTGRKTMLHVDHCHTTRKIRGLLCSTCNTSLGGFKDNLDLLRKAIQYLELQDENAFYAPVQEEPRQYPSIKEQIESMKRGLNHDRQA